MPRSQLSLFGGGDGVVFGGGDDGAGEGGPFGGEARYGGESGGGGGRMHCCEPEAKATRGGLQLSPSVDVLSPLTPRIGAHARPLLEALEVEAEAAAAAAAEAQAAPAQEAL